MWLEHNGFSKWVHESTSILAFPTILLLHTIGMALVVGIAAAISLRILGFAPALPLAPMERFLPVLWAGFWLNAITGTVLFAVEARKRSIQTDFWIKMLFIALAVVTLRMIQKRVFQDSRFDTEPVSTQAKVLAGTSLLFWIGAIVAGRLLAYVGQIG